jgi:hypothetical protein
LRAERRRGMVDSDIAKIRIQERERAVRAIKAVYAEETYELDANLLLGKVIAKIQSEDFK